MRSTVSTFVVVVCAVMLVAACQPGRPRASPTTIPAPASWNIQWRTAVEAAMAIDPAAVLDRIQASSIPNAANHTPLTLSFQFIRPTGAMVQIAFRDTDISGTTDVRSTGLATNARRYPALTEQQRIEAALATVQLSPAEVVARTATEAERFQQQHQERIHAAIVLRFDPEVERAFGIPAVWSVMYTSTSDTLRFWVDPTTGTILKRVEGPIS